MHPANEKRRYNVTSFLISWAHIQNDPCISIRPPQSEECSVWFAVILWRPCGIDKHLFDLTWNAFRSDFLYPLDIYSNNLCLYRCLFYSEWLCIYMHLCSHVMILYICERMGYLYQFGSFDNFYSGYSFLFGWLGFTANSLPHLNGGGYKNDFIMGAIASQITSLTIVYSTVIQTQIKENIKAPRHWPLCGEFTGDRWIPRTNGQ